MNQTLCLIIVAAGCISLGCSNAQVVPDDAIAATAPQQQGKDANTVTDQLGNLVDKVKSKTPSMDDVKGMFNKAGDATEQTADDAMKWANDTFKSLSDKGMTQKKNVQDWLAEDWNNASAWEYKVVAGGTDIEGQQKKLNESGNNHWECFHVATTRSGITFYMKRQKKSYMKNLPLKDVLKLLPLVPLLDGE